MTQVESQGDTALPPAPRKRPSRARVILTFAVVLAVMAAAFVGTNWFLHHNPFAGARGADCETVNARLLDVGADVQEGVATAVSDPQSMVEKLEAATGAMDATLEKLTDEEVKAGLRRADDSVKALAADLRSLIADPTAGDAAAMESEMREMTAAFEAMGTVCN